MCCSIVSNATKHSHPYFLPQRGAGTPPAFKPIIGNALKYDLTELSGLDLLSSPTGPIAVSQAQAAKIWGADASWWLVNGSTVGIQAAILASITSPSDTIILARNVHLSAYNAAILAGCRVRYVMPCTTTTNNNNNTLAHHVTPQALKSSILSTYQETGSYPKAVVIVSPTYYGILSDIPSLAAVCEEYGGGIALIVDEAHGAHLGLDDPRLPPSSIQLGADISVQSTHKVLGAMTQGSMMHFKERKGGERRGGNGETEAAEGKPTSPTACTSNEASPFLPNAERISIMLNILQTSSPSYLVMASLDAAAAAVAQPGAFNQCLEAAELARNGIMTMMAMMMNDTHNDKSIPHLTLLNSSTNMMMIDPLRLTLLIDTDALHMTGYDMCDELERDYGIVAELAGVDCIVFAFGIGSTIRDGQSLVDALAHFVADKREKEKREGKKRNTKINDADTNITPASHEHPSSPILPPLPPLTPLLSPIIKLTPREAVLFSQHETVPLSTSIGRVCAELLCPYPPGIPVVVPGEVITTEAVQALQCAIYSGGKVTGSSCSSYLSGSGLESIKVCC